MSNKWNVPKNKDLNSKIAIVTGANTGLGFETAKAFAELGATVILACRNTEKGNRAKDKILQQVPKANLEVSRLDLADFDSIRQFADRFNSNHKKLDFLINNAGVMMPPYHETEEDHELQWGVNHLGHFLMTSLLWKKLTDAEAARVVQLSSLAHTWGNTSAFKDPIGKSNYDKQKAYGNSKLACLVFALELERRIESKGLRVKSMAAHPGVADTELSRYLPGWMKALSPLFMSLVANTAEEGAQPSLRAALDEELSGGTYVGPSGFKEMKGSAEVVEPHEKATSEKAGKELWQASEEQIGISFAV